MGKILVGNVTGPSVYDIAVAEGFVGTEAQWLASLVGDVTPAATAAKAAAEAAATSATNAKDAAQEALGTVDQKIADVPTPEELSDTIDQKILDAAPPAASATAAGLVELATTAEVITGTDTVRAVTPAGAAAADNARNLTGTYAARPTAASVPAGTLYFCSNIPEVYRSNGTVWSVVQSGGNELGYSERTSNFTVTTGANTALDVTGVSISFVMPERPVYLKVGFLAQYISATQDAVVQVFDTATGLPVAEFHAIQSANSGEYGQVNGARRITGTPGVTRTFKLVAIQRGAVAWTLLGSANYPTWLGAFTA